MEFGLTRMSSQGQVVIPAPQSAAAIRFSFCRPMASSLFTRRPSGRRLLRGLLSCFNTAEAGDDRHRETAGDIRHIQGAGRDNHIAAEGMDTRNTAAEGTDTRNMPAAAEAAARAVLRHIRTRHRRPRRWPPRRRPRQWRRQGHPRRGNAGRRRLRGWQ